MSLLARLLIILALLALANHSAAGPFSNVGKDKETKKDDTPKEDKGADKDDDLKGKAKCARDGHDFEGVSWSAWQGGWPVPGFPMCTKKMRTRKCKRQGCWSNESEVKYSAPPPICPCSPA